jgi:UDP-3-O-[3-hydroxymyristoyl] glucosamine N-acyltransferase
MKLPRLILAFIATICLIFAGNALAQTDININNTNLIRFGGSVTVPANQVVENAHAFGGNVTISPNARVVDTAIALGGDVILKTGARVDGDAYSIGGKIVQEPGSTIGGERSILQQFLVGLAILTGSSLIPFLGGLVVSAVNLFGLGAILLWQFGREKPPITV